MADRAWSTFTVDIKSLDADARVLEGIASTPEIDRMGDSMDPAGAVFTLPLKFLWQHRQDQPIGNVIAARVTDAGIWMKAQLAPAGVLPFIDDAWRLIKAGLVGGLSIDWLPLAAPTMLSGGGRRFKSWSWLALSAVTIPANQTASITLIKSLDLSSPRSAAPGGSVRPVHRPGASGDPRRVIPMFNVSETLTAETTAAQTKGARLAELLAEEHAHGALEADQATERETLLAEVDQHTTKIKHLKSLEAVQLAVAAPIVPVATRTIAGAAPRAQVVALPKGTLAVRWLLAVAAGKGSYADTYAYAKRFTNTPEVAAHVKATFGSTQPGAGSPPSGWGSELVPESAASEFVELLNPALILGKIPGGLNNVPFNTAIITQTGASTFEWVGEGMVKPVGELAFDKTTIGVSKAAGIIVLSEELVRLSRPSAEETVKRDMIAQCARFLNAQFIQAANAGGTDHPASITHGAQTVPSTGTDQATFLADLNTALAYFDAAEISTENLVMVTTPTVARGLSTVLTPQGGRAFPEMAPTGGSLLGYPMIVSSLADAGTITIFPPSEILLADDGNVSLDSSNQATLAMTGSTPTFNLWQNNAIAIRAERWIRWQPRRADVVVVMTGVTVGPAMTHAATPTQHRPTPKSNPTSAYSA